MTVTTSGGLEIRGPADALLDEPLRLNARGAGPDAEVTWQARYLDDDARVWRASAVRSGDLLLGLAPAKAGTGEVAVLASLRPVNVEVRVQAPDGRAATRTLVRRFLGEDVRIRRWRDGLTATLHLPARGHAPSATIIIDATAGPGEALVATLAAPLLASRGVMILTVGPARDDGPAAERLARARDLMAAVPGTTPDLGVVSAVDPHAEEPSGGEPRRVVVLPPGVGARDREPGAAGARAATWDALLGALGAQPREVIGLGPAAEHLV